MFFSGEKVNFMSMLFLVVLTVFTRSGESHWWSLANQPSVNSLLLGANPNYCSTLDTLSRNQKALCQRYIGHMEYVSDGAKDGINECKFQFRNRRWNCSTVDDDSVFGKVIKTGSKETAFTYAISAAGVVVAVAKACKNEQLEGHCGCSNAKRPDGLNNDWNWGGCGDDTQYAYGFAREFIDARERDMISKKRSKERDRKEMNKHNNEAGRMVAVRSARPSCKCHGVSGSCSIKTCWMQVPTFREIGNQLMAHYETAVEVRGNRRGILRRRKGPTLGPLPRISLIYLDSSPDYCIRNKRTGVHGTRGRECKKKASGPEGCGLMCCGRGSRPYKVTIVKSCKCKFQWCCAVKCETCTSIVRQHICK